MSGRVTRGTNTEGNRIGFFGKVPTHGDFVTTGLDRHLQTAFDNWIQLGIRACETEFGLHWKSLFANLPPWRFVMAPSAWSSAPIAGVLIASRDRVGRHYPLVVTAQLGSYQDNPRRLQADDTWFIAAEALAETISKRDFDINTLIAGLDRLRMPRSDFRHGADELPDGQSLWWTIDSVSGKPSGFHLTSTPDTAAFDKLIRTSQKVIDAQGPQTHPLPAAADPPQAGAKETETPRAEPAHAHSRLRHSRASHAGTRLVVNTHDILASPTQSLFALATGIGTDHQAAEAASTTTGMLASARAHHEAAAMIQEVKGKLGRANGVLQSTRHKGATELGASVAVAAIMQGHLSIVWAGDVRCYLLREGMVRCLTRDHVEIGMRYRLSRFIGSQRRFMPETVVETAEPGDILLLCSAAVMRLLGERTMAHLLIDTDLEEVADVIVQNCLIANASDNISVLAVGIDR